MERDLTSRLMQDMDPELLDFLHTYVDSFVKWDLLHFFHENPHTIDTVENIARYAGRDPEIVERALNDLTQRQLLEETPMGGMVVYSLTTAPEKREKLDRFIQASHDRQFRVKAVFHMVRGMNED